MQNKHNIPVFFLFLFLVFFCTGGLSQKLISYKAENQPLNEVLTKIFSTSKVSFGLDDDNLSKIIVTFNISNLSVDALLKQLSVDYPIGYKLIGKTWVVYKVEKKVEVVRPRPKVGVLKPLPPPPIKRKIIYKKSRLWDLIGIVIDGKSGNRLKYCQLYVDDYTTPVTNNMGFFSDEVIGMGDVRIRVNQQGYYPLDTALVLADGREIVLKLKPLWEVGNSITGIYKGLFQFNIPESPNLLALNPRLGSYFPGVESNDFANSFNPFSGIYLSDGNNTGLTTRGISPSENMIMMDGIPMFNSSHLSGQVSTVNSKFVHQAFISRGGFGAEYGGGTSGIIDLTSRSGQGRTVVDFTASMLDANLFVGIPVTPKVALSGSFRKSIVDYWPNYYYQNLSTKPVSIQNLYSEVGKGVVTDPFTNFYDINMKVAYQPNRLNEINFIVSTGYDKQDRSYNIAADKDYFTKFQSDWRNYSFGLNWKFRSKNFWYNTLVASFNSLDQQNLLETGFKAGDSGNSGLLQTGSDLNHSTHALLKWKSEFTSKKLSNQFGAEFNFHRLEYNYLFKDDQSMATAILPDSITDNNNKLTANLFYQGKYKLNNWLELTAGVRSFFDISTGNISLQPRVGADIIPNGLCKFYYRFGRYVQPFYQTQRFGPDLTPVAVWMLPTASNQLLKSYHHIAGGNFIYNRLFINVESYIMNSSGKATYFANMNNKSIVNATSYNIYTGLENRMGVDAIIQYHRRMYSQSIAYSYSDSKQQINGINNNQYFQSFTHHHHRLKLNETISYSGWIATASFSYLTGAPYLLQKSTQSQFNFSKLPDFSQLDFSLIRQFSLKGIKVEAGAVLLNVLGSKIEKEINFYRQGEAPSAFIIKSTTYGIPFTPTFFVNLKFD
jgi:ferric enterobactin receptor